MEIKVGTCGFQKSRKAHYESLDVLEVQQTFYDPRVGDYARWRREAPARFEFTVKAWMLVSHEYNRNLWSRLKGEIPGKLENYGFLKMTEEVLWAWEKTLEAASKLEAKAIVIQTPPSFRSSEENRRRVVEFFRSIPRGGRILVWEPRGDWWGKVEDLERISSEAEIVIGGDALRGRVLKTQSDIVYFRLHGLGGDEVNYRYKYTDSDLKELQSIINRLQPQIAYVLFNNIYSFDDALRFKKIISSH